ncbi:MAG: CPBP family intramembrane glutamic endopeptidase [Chloroflexota bacterium]
MNRVRVFVSFGVSLLLICILVLSLRVINNAIGFASLLGLETHPNELTDTIAVVVAVIIAWVYIDGRKLEAVGYSQWALLPYDFLSGFVVVLLSALIVAYVYKAGYHKIPEVASIVSGLFSGFLTGIREELLFRRLAFENFSDLFGNRLVPPIALSSLAFGFWHSHSLLEVAVISFAGLILVCAFISTRSLWFLVAFHMTWNGLTGKIIPVSEEDYLVVNFLVLLFAGLCSVIYYLARKQFSKRAIAQP